jgi:hypothetical protein
MKTRNFVKKMLKQKDFHLSAQDVRKIIGVDAGSFQQWLARDLIPFETVTAGRRTWRRFHVQEVPRLVLISELWKIGVLIGEANVIAGELLQFLSERDDAIWAVLWFRANKMYRFVSEAELQANAFTDIFCGFDRASCVFILVEGLKRKIENAVATATAAHEARAANGRTET